MTKVSTISWKRAAGFAFLAVYGPLLVMTIYTLLFVSCSHCRGSAWMLLPCAPGMIPYEAISLGLHWPKPTNAFAFYALTITASLTTILVLACLARWDRRLRFTTLGVALVASSYSAIILLAKIQG